MSLKRVLLAGCATATLLQGAASAADNSTKMQSESVQKDTNIDAAQKLNGDSRTAAGQDKPGVKESNADIPQGKPIHGFHPIKKAMQPLNNLEAMSLKLEQQIMKLEGPIAALQSPMQQLQVGIDGVSDRISDTQSRLNGLNTQVTQVRADLHLMQKDIASLTKPIVNLQGPISTVAKPLGEVERRLNMIIVAILCAGALVCIGTPLAAVLVYKNRAAWFASGNPREDESEQAVKREALTH